MRGGLASSRPSLLTGPRGNSVMVSLPVDRRLHCISMRRRSDRGRAINPILALGRKEIDVDCVLRADEFVRRIRRDDQHHAGRHYELLALRIYFAATLGNPRGLFVRVVMQRKY